MKRELELVRKILLYLDEKEGPEPIKVPPIKGYGDPEIKYHLVLLYDAGFIYGEPTKSTTSDRTITVLPFDLTWQGHEFLDAARDPTTWEKAKQTLRDAGKDLGTVTLAVLHALLIETAKKSLGL